jgi:hypothetical protein
MRNGNDAWFQVLATEMKNGGSRYETEILDYKNSDAHQLYVAIQEKSNEEELQHAVCTQKVV